jgi:hypothetical protein
MEAERVGHANRIAKFVLSRVSPEFFRTEAVGNPSDSWLGPRARR